MIRKLVRLQPGEDKPFFYLFVHAFFNGLGISLAYAVINIIVIKKQGIEILPWLYIASSVLMILAGIVYNKLEHAYPAKKVFIFSLIFCVVWAFSMRFLLGPDKSLLFIGLAYSTYYLILVLTNLDLWGAAALVFNVRQSKRLFGPLSFAESIGGIIGYSLSPFLVLFMPVQDMMILAGISFLVSVAVLYSLRNKYLLEDHHHDHSRVKHSLHEPINVDVENFWSRLFHNNAYIKQLSVVILLSTLVYYTLTYGFLNRVEVQFTSLTDIAWFIGMFLSIAKIMNLVIKFVFSSHVFTKLGVHFGFFLLPIIVISISIIGLGCLVSGVEDAMFYIYLFSALYFFDKLFRSSLSKPSYLILFQPLTPGLRLSGHTIAKGYFEPFAMGLAGLIIIVAKYLGWFSLESLVIYILVLSIFWLISCRAAIRHYLNVLQAALQNRLFGSSSFELSKKEVELIIETKLKSHNEVDKLYALSLLHGKIPRELESMHYRGLLSSNQTAVVLESLKEIEEKKIQIDTDVLKSLLDHHDLNIRTQTAYCYAQLLDENAVDLLINKIDEKPKANNVFIGALVKYAGIKGTLAVGHKLMALVNSENRDDRILAASIIDKTDNPDYNTIIQQLLQDSDPEVVESSIKACGSTATLSLLNDVFSHLNERRYLSSIKHCAKESPELAQQVISSLYPDSPMILKRRLIDVSGHIKSLENTSFLVSHLTTKDKLMLQRIIRALSTQHYKALNSSDKKAVHEAIDSNVYELTSLSKIYKKLDDHLPLKNGMKSEMYSIYVNNILGLMSFIYHHETVDKIIRHVGPKADPTDVANAIELLENMLPNKWSNRFIPILELLRRPPESKRIPSKKGIESFIRIAGQQSVLLSDYLNGLLIRTARELKIPLQTEFLTLVQENQTTITTEELTLSLE